MLNRLQKDIEKASFVQKIASASMTTRVETAAPDFILSKDFLKDNDLTISFKTFKESIESEKDNNEAIAKYVEDGMFGDLTENYNSKIINNDEEKENRKPNILERLFSAHSSNQTQENKTVQNANRTGQGRSKWKQLAESLESLLKENGPLGQWKNECETLEQVKHSEISEAKKQEIDLRLNSEMDKALSKIDNLLFQGAVEIELYKMWAESYMEALLVNKEKKEKEALELKKEMGTLFQSPFEKSKSVDIYEKLTKGLQKKYFEYVKYHRKESLL